MWKTGLQTDTELTGEVLIDRVSIDTYGRLVVEFQSRTHFRGLFVDKHHSIPSETKATFEPPMNVQTNFTLELVWTEETYETPVQVHKNQKISGYLFFVFSTGKQSRRTVERTTLENTISTLSHAV